MHQETIHYVPIDRLECEAQVRREFTELALIGLARSMQEVGLQQALRVRQDGERWIVVDGERRLRAARLAKLATVPVIVEERPLNESEVLQRQIVANVQRAELSPCERAAALKRLIESRDWTRKQAAESCGLSCGMATKLLAVLDLPEPLRQQVESGQIPISGAYELSRVDDSGRQAELARQMVEGNLTRDGVAGAVRAEAKSETAKSTCGLKRLTIAAGDGTTVSVTGPALTTEGLVASLEAVLTKARRARSRGLDIKELAKQLRREASAEMAQPSPSE